MRIKHTPSESYKVYSYLPCNGELFKGIKRWYFYNHYSTKKSALSAIKRVKDRCNGDILGKELIWKIVWCPYPLASEDKCITVYTEEV